ncbi:MAG: hypothetical protein WD036_03315, partial [Bauldia sp.]
MERRRLSPAALARLEAAEPTAKAEANRQYLTATVVADLRPRPTAYMVWDIGDHRRKSGPDPARGLAVLVNPRGTKTWKAVFYFRGT